MPKAGGECNSYPRHRFAIEDPIWTPNVAKWTEKAPEPANRGAWIEIRPIRPTLGADHKHMMRRHAKEPPFQHDEGIP
ncbi:protein of unknown function [Bradyrhizobium vignae]|uniref:Uncharacterized protein n=1 Tax=Bradyrhizobium vignae TaxID=1549949 RepID=A0A2U3PQL5_9BRAD|nr:protein of unknown function [Bradyrhizobium vignae]